MENKKMNKGDGMKKKEGGQKMKRKTLEGHDAVEYARNNNLLLKKWADPTEPYRDELPLREAEAVCLEDPGLIFIEIDLAEEKK